MLKNQNCWYVSTYTLDCVTALRLSPLGWINTIIFCYRQQRLTQNLAVGSKQPETVKVINFFYDFICYIYIIRSDIKLYVILC